MDRSRWAARTVWTPIAVLFAVLVVGCEVKSTSSSATTAGAPEKTTTAAAAGDKTTMEARPAVKTTETGAAMGATGRIYRIVLSDGMDGGHYCVRISQPKQPVRLGDAVRWVSKASRKIMVDINGTSPMTRGHFEIPPRGADGDVITYHGEKVFYYSVLPNECTGEKPSPEIIVTAAGSR
jgi:hypothetical protein